MSRPIPQLETGVSKEAALAQVRAAIADWGYRDLFEVNEDKPWGAYYRFQAEDAPRFVEEFFPEVSYEEACLGDVSAELSPKILVVAPGQRLSWQYHDRRAERWCFLTPGAYHRGMSDDEGERLEVAAGEVVQFVAGERHRLCAGEGYVVVAEIWQHTDKSRPSDEGDIVRLADDYQR